LPLLASAPADRAIYRSFLSAIRRTVANRATIAAPGGLRLQFFLTRIAQMTSNAVGPSVATSWRTLAWSWRNLALEPCTSRVDNPRGGSFLLSRPAFFVSERKEERSYA
jgi:hypothetical protein